MKDEFNLYIEPEELNYVNINSLLFNKNTLISSLIIDNYKLIIEVNGDTRIYNNDNNEVYKYIEDYPEDLFDKIKSGDIYNNDKYYVDESNWFEYYIKENDKEIKSGVAELEGLLNKFTIQENINELRSFMCKLLDNYVNRDIKTEGIINPPDVQAEISESDLDDKDNSTILNSLEQRVGQQMEVGRLNALLQNIFSMYNKTFILPTDLYNMDLDSTQELVITDTNGNEFKEYTLLYDIIDIDSGLIQIVAVNES